MARGSVRLDAAMGTRLIARGLRLEDDDPALWNERRPEAVASVHGLDVAAGAEALVTNTFGANRAWLARFGRADDVARLNARAVALARAAAGPDRPVIGSIGPTASGPPGVEREQAEALVEAGVDGVLFETYRLDEAERALRAVGPELGVPRIVSLVSWPDDVRQAARRLEGLGVAALGANCQVGPAPAVRLGEALRQATALPLWLKPAAGLPGGPLAGPERFAAELVPLLALGPVLLGGCCGTHESYVAALGAAWYPEGPSGRKPETPCVDHDRSWRAASP
jgi:methionine synthase I (cobalamin-dependent)